MKPLIGISYWQKGGNPIKRAVLGRIERWASVDLLDPEEQHFDILNRDYDLYHMAKRRRASLFDLNRASSAGIPTINPFEDAWLSSDRLMRTMLLEEAGLPVPTYEYGTTDQISLSPPVVVKPRWEWAADAHEFSITRTSPVEFKRKQLVEQYVPHDRVLKAYGIGGRAYFIDDASKVTVSEVPAVVEDLFVRVRSVLDLTFLEIDIAVSGDSCWIFDVNPVISLAGVDDAPAIYEAELRERCANKSTTFNSL